MGVKMNLEALDTKTEVAETGEVSVSNTDNRVDEYIKLEAHIKAEQEKIKTSEEMRRLNELKQEFADECDKKPADQKVPFTGSKYDLEFGAKSNTTTVTSVKLAAELLGDTFWDIASVPIGKLKDYLTKPDYEKVTDQNRTGSRSNKKIPR